MIGIYVALLLAWSAVCVTAGRIWEMRQRMAQLDEEMQQLRTLETWGKRE